MSGMFNFDVPDGALDIGGAVASGNPYFAAFQIASSLFGGGSVKISSGATGGTASSGAANFFGENAVRIKKPLLSQPVNVAIIAACVVAGVYIYKKKLR